jgi:hypothetical protein
MTSEGISNKKRSDGDNTTTYEYYKLLGLTCLNNLKINSVEEYNTSGVFYRQNDICQPVKDFIITTKKNPVSLLNTYCNVVGEPLFKFYEYELKGRPDKKYYFTHFELNIIFSKYIFVSELDGQPVFGFPSPTKKEARKSCACCLLEKLFFMQRVYLLLLLNINFLKLNCLSSDGRKLKHSSNQPQQSISFTSTSNEDLGNIGTEYYQNQPESVDPTTSSFAEDIDFDDPNDLKIIEEKQVLHLLI